MICLLAGSRYTLLTSLITTTAKNQRFAEELGRLKLQKNPQGLLES